MTSDFATVLLWLLILNLGVAFGAGLYEHRIVVPAWISRTVTGGFRWDAECARRDDTGRRFWALTSTVPLTLLTLANLFVAWRSSGATRSWWLAAGLAALADRLVTFAYFIPTMVRLMRAENSPEAVAIARRWSHLNYVRHGFVLAAWLAALKTFAILYAQTG